MGNQYKGTFVLLKQGLSKFIPVPPNTSFPITTENAGCLNLPSIMERLVAYKVELAFLLQGSPH
jgi:hypothetical protein